MVNHGIKTIELPESVPAKIADSVMFVLRIIGVWAKPARNDRYDFYCRPPNQFTNSAR